jgi:hypothetical protein
LLQRMSDFWAKTDMPWSPGDVRIRG